jgi:anti-sigma regulatory factor (Ser/Thr protein kinase)
VTHPVCESFLLSPTRQDGDLVRRTQVSPASVFGFQRTSMADDWPLQTYLELGALPSAVPCARSHAREVLWEWGLSELSETVELLVSELVTNAVKTTRAMSDSFVVRFRLLADNSHVMIIVWDANPEPPARVNATDDDESGRGLLLVEALSKKWDWYVLPEFRGKEIWAIVGI